MATPPPEYLQSLSTKENIAPNLGFRNVLKIVLLLIFSTVLVLLTTIHVRTAFGNFLHMMKGRMTEIEWDHESLTSGGIFGEL
mmetsp:Transcript_36983/g.86347  ORF Transcript_36983/g.86347 Transcript_36983/m.86347 type:complete len:83 (-) Transcript_36983:217-465(-)